MNALLSQSLPLFLFQENARNAGLLPVMTGFGQDGISLLLFEIGLPFSKDRKR
jgi:hypothetical protein